MLLEWIGYIASVIVLISLLMSSIRKLRWVNLLGSITFAVYGFLIGSLPVGFLNIGTVIINVYYLTKMYASKDFFKVLYIKENTKYLEYFVNYYKEDMSRFMVIKDINIDSSELTFFILRNVVPAGMFVSSKVDDHTLKIDVDYAVPQYRDFKMGSYLFTKKKNLFLEKGYTNLLSYTNNPKHEKYLVKMGFVKLDELCSSDMNCFQKILA
jgi:hypothetical protein